MENSEVKDKAPNSKKTVDKTCEIDEHITNRYDVKKRLGKGAYGIVYKAVDRKNNETVAIKKIFDAFRNQTDAQRTYREIFFLRAFRRHPHIIKLHNVHRAYNNNDIYLVFEYMQTDLHNVIKCGNILKDIHKRYIMYQILKATKYIHSGNVIHRDQKPSNVLIDNTCRVKIADFGLARSVSKQDRFGGSNADPCLTDYVATRWYRAPEILIASKTYTKGVDLWSLGCILGEMVNGKPLFPGTSTVDQLEKIMSCLPVPSESDIAVVCTGYGSCLIRTAVKKRTTLREILINASEDALDLISCLLVFNPMHRRSAAQALSHPYVMKFNHDNNDPILTADVIPPLCEDLRLSIDEYRNRIYGLTRKGTTRTPENTRESTAVSSAGKQSNDSRILENSRNIEKNNNAIIRKSNSKQNLQKLNVIQPRTNKDDVLTKIYNTNLQFYNKHSKKEVVNDEAKEKKRNPLFKTRSLEEKGSLKEITVQSRSELFRLKTEDVYKKRLMSKDTIFSSYSSM